MEATRLRSIEDLNAANEFIFSSVREHLIDQKTADALNTTLKNATYLNVKLRLDALKLLFQAQSKKITLPANLLPVGLDMDGLVETTDKKRPKKAA